MFESLIKTVEQYRVAIEGGSSTDDLDYFKNKIGTFTQKRIPSGELEDYTSSFEPGVGSHVQSLAECEYTPKTLRPVNPVETLKEIDDLLVGLRNMLQRVEIEAVKVSVEIGELARKAASEETQKQFEAITKDVTDKTLKTLLNNFLRDHNAKMSYSYSASSYRPPAFMANLTEAVWNKLQCKNWVGVQPMAGPVAQIIALEVCERKTIADNSLVENYPMPNNSMSITLAQKIVQAKTRRLSAKLVHSSDDRIENLPAVDALAKEIAEEIDANVYRSIRILGIGIGYEQISLEDLKEEVSTISSEIATTSRRGPANFMIVSTETVKKINPDDYEGIQIYSLDSVNDNDILLGYKGMSNVDSVVFYAPYVLVTDSGVLVDPNTFDMVNSFYTRYGWHEQPNASAYFRLIKLNDEEKLVWQ
jgi:hypothetical protein